MTKQQFLRRMEVEKPLEGIGVNVVIDKLVEGPNIIGIYQEGGIWKIYETEERGGYFIIDLYSDEELAFDELYEQVYVQKELGEYL